MGIWLKHVVDIVETTKVSKSDLKFNLYLFNLETKFF